MSALLIRWRKAGLSWPTVLALMGLAILVGLGNWQMSRKVWKEALIAKIAQRVGAPPIPLANDSQVARVETDDAEYLHVSVKGRFHHDKERYLYAPAPAGLGWHVYSPLEWAPGRFVWINRGFVPDARKDPSTRTQGQLAGEVEISGLLRIRQAKSMFTPDNDVARNLWYWPDVAAMQASAFGTAANAAAFTVDTDARSEPPGGLPRGGVTRLDLPNRHLEYALTWYGLALTLIAVFVAFARGRLRFSEVA